MPHESLMYLIEIGSPRRLHAWSSSSLVAFSAVLLIAEYIHRGQAKNTPAFKGELS